MITTKKPLVLNQFCFRQFIKAPGSSTIDFDPQEFVDKINQIWLSTNIDLQPGYAPFCKHIFIPNFTTAHVYYAKIDNQNKQFLETEYFSRTEKELPVLRRFFKKESFLQKKAEYLDLILYSREQIELEEQAISYKDAPFKLDQTNEYDWGIISVKAQDENYEIGMDPITVMRNALGTQEGGSGVPLNKESYLKSVEFWSQHAIII